MQRREGGIIWHTQGSGKSLTMVWLAKWIREHVQDARVLIITDRTELDEQIEKVFKGVNEEIYRTKSGADLIARLNATTPWLVCSLIHKFGGKEDGEEVGDIAGYIAGDEEGAAAGLHGQGRPLRLRGRVPPHPVRRAARGDEGDPARAPCSSASPARRC